MAYIRYERGLKMSRIKLEKKDSSAMIKDHFIEKVQLQLEFKEEWKIYKSDMRNNKQSLQKHESRRISVQRNVRSEPFNATF